MIAVIDYDAGNLASVQKALEALNEPSKITRDKREILSADGVILPGVGAFGDAMEKLERYDLVETIKETAKSGKPFLGICMGLQLLFESSEESPGKKGLGICKGKILRIPVLSAEEEDKKETYKIPHMGWNSLKFDHPGRLFKGIPENSYVYFVHSYYLHASDPAIVTASTKYSVDIHASIEQDNVFACQFHPEKSSKVGLSILKNFLKVTKEGLC